MEPVRPRMWGVFYLTNNGALILVYELLEKLSGYGPITHLYMCFSKVLVRFDISLDAFNRHQGSTRQVGEAAETEHHHFDS